MIGGTQLKLSIESKKISNSLKSLKDNETFTIEGKSYIIFLSYSNKVSMIADNGAALISRYYGCP